MGGWLNFIKGPPTGGWIGREVNFHEHGHNWTRDLWTEPFHPIYERIIIDQMILPWTFKVNTMKRGYDHKNDNGVLNGIRKMPSFTCRVISFYPISFRLRTKTSICAPIIYWPPEKLIVLWQDFFIAEYPFPIPQVQWYVGDSMTIFKNKLG